MGKTTVLVMEMQRGVVGDLTKFPDLVEACRRHDVITNTATLLQAARAAGMPVIHCTAAFRLDRAGSHTANCPFIVALLKDPAHLLDGTPPVAVLPELREEGDLESRRHHGFSPFTGAVAGIPEDYAQAVLKHTISLLATRVTTATLVEEWKA